MDKEIIDKLKDKKILVIGDLMLDKYINGTVNRISPEAPIPIVDVDDINYKLGGAGNVVDNLLCTNSKIFVVSAVGKDKEGMSVIALMNNKNICKYILTRDRETTLKTRVVSNNQQMLRYDVEDKKRNTMQEEAIFLDMLIKIKKENVIDIIIVSDYAKGIITRNIMDTLKSYFKDAIIIVDPKPQNQQIYGSVDFMTPNKNEASEILMKNFPNTNFIITEGADGVSILTKDIQKHIPTVAKEVCDVSGAGDTFVAIFTAMYSVTNDIIKSVEYANKASGIVVGKHGTAILTKEEFEQL